VSESNGTASGRGPDGRFTIGNRYGKGRPPRPTEVAYLATLADAVSLADWKAITEKAVDDAKGGDGAARAWLSKYVLGESPPTITDTTAAELTDGPFWGLVEAVAKRRQGVRFHQERDRGEVFLHSENLVEAACGLMTAEDFEELGMREMLADLLFWHVDTAPDNSSEPESTTS
jgi:hypothetical protein